MQQQTHSLCQEPFRSHSSANMFSNHCARLSSVFEVWLGFGFSGKRVTALLFPFVVLKNHAGLSFFFFFPSPTLYVRCFVPLPPPSPLPPQTADFSGTTLMRPSHRFHGDSHKTVKFPLFKKKSWRWGCSPTVRDTASKSVVIPFRRWTSHFWRIQPLYEPPLPVRFTFFFSLSFF